MTKYNANQIYALARKAGFSTGEAVTATAVALAESGGDDAATGDLSLQTAKWGPSVGLWQVRTLKAETGKGTTRDINWLRASPENQAKAAYEIRSGKNGWGNWSVFTSGAYKSNVSAVEQSVGTQERIGGEQWWQKFTIVDNIASAVTGTDNNDVAANASAGANKVVGWTDNLNKILETLGSGEFWKRFGWGFGGAVLIIICIIVMLWSQKSKIVGGVVGDVVKTVKKG